MALAAPVRRPGGRAEGGGARRSRPWPGSLRRRAAGSSATEIAPTAGSSSTLRRGSACGSRCRIRRAPPPRRADRRVSMRRTPSCSRSAWEEPWGLVPLEAMASGGRSWQPAAAGPASICSTAETRCCSTQGTQTLPPRSRLAGDPSSAIVCAPADGGRPWSTARPSSTGGRWPRSRPPRQARADQDTRALACARRRSREPARPRPRRRRSPLSGHPGVAAGFPTAAPPQQPRGDREPWS